MDRIAHFLSDNDNLESEALRMYSMSYNPSANIHDVKGDSSNLQLLQTCQCCFQDDVPFYSSYGCVGGDHSFCMSCIQKYVEEWVFGGSIYALQDRLDGTKALPCLNAGLQTSNTRQFHYIPPSVIQSCVPAPTYSAFWERLDFISKKGQTQERLAEPNFPVPPRKEEKQGRMPSHQWTRNFIGNKCHKATEALTKARLRRCPFCQTQFFKELSTCNRIQCPTCQKVNCDVCR